MWNSATGTNARGAHGRPRWRMSGSTRLLPRALFMEMRRRRNGTLLSNILSGGRQVVLLSRPRCANGPINWPRTAHLVLKGWTTVAARLQGLVDPREVQGAGKPGSPAHLCLVPPSPMPSPFTSRRTMSPSGRGHPGADRGVLARNFCDGPWEGCMCNGCGRGLALQVLRSP